MVLSWVGFFLNREATSDRVGLGKRLFYLIQSDSFGLDKTLGGDTVHITHVNLLCRHHDGADAVDDLAGQPDVAAQGALRHRPRLVPRLQLRILHRHAARVRRRPLLHQGTRRINNLHFRRGGEFIVELWHPCPLIQTPSELCYNLRDKLRYPRRTDTKDVKMRYLLLSASGSGLLSYSDWFVKYG